MSGLSSFLFNTLSRALFRMDDENTGPHKPSIEDVLDVKYFLLKKCTLPMEIVDIIVDFAEYWPHTTTIRTSGEDFRVYGNNPGQENKLILRTYPLGYIPAREDPTECSMLDSEKFPTIQPVPRNSPLPSSKNTTQDILNRWAKDSQSRGKFPCRKIVFTIKSHDQGWGGQRGQRGTYKGAYTWFEVGKERLTTLRNRTPGPYEKVSKSANNSNPLYNPEPFSGPRFALSPDINGTSKLEKSTESILCTSYTLSPAVESRKTAHEPPRTELSFVHPLLPSGSCLQKNLTATRDTQENAITWTCHDNVNPESLEAKALDAQGRGVATLTGEYVRNMKVGDIVTVWAKARFQGWCNSVEEVKIDVYWAV